MATFREFGLLPSTEEPAKKKVPEKVEYVRFEAGHKRAKEVIAQKMKGRDHDDFVDGIMYSQENVDGAKKKVAEMEVEFEAERNEGTEEEVQAKHRRKMMADCLEAIFLYTRSWFGPTARLFPTTKWDDYMNGVDMVAERHEGDLVDHHGFALDITYGGSKTVLKKMKGIADGIKKGLLAQVSFFKSGDGKFKGQLGDIPLIVIGADGNTMMGLINTFAEGEGSHVDKKLSEHPFQFQMIDQIMQQCDFFIECARKCSDKKRGAEIISAYERLRDSFIPVLKLKEKLLPDVDKNYRDKFHSHMDAAMKEIRIQSRL